MQRLSCPNEQAAGSFSVGKGSQSRCAETATFSFLLYSQLGVFTGDKVGRSGRLRRKLALQHREWQWGCQSAQFYVGRFLPAARAASSLARATLISSKELGRRRRTLASDTEWMDGWTARWRMDSEPERAATRLPSLLVTSPVFIVDRYLASAGRLELSAAVIRSRAVAEYTGLYLEGV